MMKSISLFLNFTKSQRRVYVYVVRSVSQQVEHNVRMPVSHCYGLLGVNENCTEEELRTAYLEKVKFYHPDQSTPSANAAKFIQVQTAYQTALGHRSRRNQEVFEEEEENNKIDIHDIDHTVPQHRRYLTFDGVGFGTPTNRERQYRQVRVAKAADSVYEHRKMKFGSEESAVVLKDKKEARKIKISNLIERVVDDLIRESMQKGEFENLAGQGKPLDYSNHNPFVDTTTHNLNKIMVNNGYKPEWIMMSKEIRDGIQFSRESLALVRENLGPPPYSDLKELRWNQELQKFGNSLSEINSRINKFNMIVPLMNKQMIHYSYENILRKIMEDHNQFLPSEEICNSFNVSFQQPTVKPEDTRIKWNEVWSNIKDSFKLR